MNKGAIKVHSVSLLQTTEAWTFIAKRNYMVAMMTSTSYDVIFRQSLGFLNVTHGCHIMRKENMTERSSRVFNMFVLLHVYLVSFLNALQVWKPIKKQETGCGEEDKYYVITDSAMSNNAAARCLTEPPRDQERLNKKPTTIMTLHHTTFWWGHSWRCPSPPHPITLLFF